MHGSGPTGGHPKRCPPYLGWSDIQPHAMTQALERRDIPNVGGFSDAVFGVVAGFLSGDEGRFVKDIEAVEL